MEVKFCRRCGQPVTERSSGAYRCPNGHDLFYKRDNGVLAVVLNARNEVLVAIRANDPGKGTLDLPGGFLELDETPLEALRRELREETGLIPNDYTEPEFLCWALDDYAYQGETQRILATALWVRLKNDAVVVAADDVSGLQWIALADFDATKVHPDFQGVRKAIQAIRQRLDEK